MSTDIETYQDRSAVALNTSQDVAVQRLGEWAQSAQAAYSVAENLVRTSFVPEGFRGKPHEATAAILSGLEVGLSPMAALRSFDVIQGTAAPRAITLRAIVQSHGHEMEVLESTATRCKMRGRRNGASTWQDVTWTIDRAKQLGLVGKANWKNQPQAMLVARATSELARLIAADAILGIGYSSEEIADGGTTEQAVASGTTDTTPTATRKMSRRRAPEPEPEPEAQPDESPLLNPSSALAKRMFAMFNEAGITEKADRLGYVSTVIGREVTTSKEMTDADAEAVIAKLGEILTADTDSGEIHDAEIVDDADQTLADWPVEDGEQQ